MNKKALDSIFDKQLVPKSEKFSERRSLIRMTLVDDSKPRFSPDEISCVNEHITRYFAVDDVDVFSFYFHLHDNIVKELVFLRPMNRPLSFLELCAKKFVHNPAKEGGSALFGIIDSEATVMLAATYEPIFELHVDLFLDREIE